MEGKKPSKLEVRLKKIGYKLVKAADGVIEVSSDDDRIGRTFKSEEEFGRWMVDMENDTARDRNVVKYPVEEDGDSDIEQIAKTAHEANRAYCQACGDDSHAPWDDAPEWQRESVIAGVEMIITNPETTPEQSHEAWVKRKEAEGWKYGPVKDPEKKEHPCMQSYATLPPGQRAKDLIFGAVVRSFL